mmetsp:Transcript_35568/g.41166  ORF Transcript_35568/g.41166 Transcript_35568/m.41166 type:complete len:85 (-) Transcript_35568:21-275(-)
MVYPQTLPKPIGAVKKTVFKKCSVENSPSIPCRGWADSSSDNSVLLVKCRRIMLNTNDMTELNIMMTNPGTFIMMTRLTTKNPA